MNVKSLHVKVSVSVAAAALFVVVLSSHFFYARAYESSFSDSKRSVQQLLETVSTTASIAAYVGNEELAQQVAKGLFNNDIVLGARITTDDDTLSEQGKNFTEGDETVISLQLSAPFDEQEVVGEVAVQPNLPLIVMRARDSAMATTIGLAAQAGVVALFVLILVYWMMSRPLVRLSGRLHRITPGDGNRVDVSALHKSDEIGLLTADINSLLTTVEKILGEERQLRHRVELLEHRFRGIFEDSSAGIFLLKDVGQLVTANPAFYKITQLTEPSDTDTGLANVVEQIFAEPAKAQSLVSLALHSRKPCAADLELAGSSIGSRRWVHCIFSPAGSEQGYASVEGVMYDITQRKLEEEHTRELAEKDSLTGLANRQVVEATIERLVERAAADKSGFVVMMMDLDGFKEVNDTFGHDAGDGVLVAIAQRLRSVVRETDLVARLGGDEFMIVLNNTSSLATAHNIAQKIIDIQQEPIEVGRGCYVSVGVSIGVASFPEHGNDVSSLRKHADQAMYAVKRLGKNNYTVYEAAMGN
jgi:diguanylate cyclase (GGDEF)-like protein/PAS domain S-box-containing protein